MVEHSQEHDIVLVSTANATLPKNLFSSILSYCEIKKTTNPDSYQNVHKQCWKVHELMDMAGHVTSN